MGGHETFGSIDPTHAIHFGIGAYPAAVLSGGELRHPETTLLPHWLVRPRTTRLDEITHLACGARGLRLGTVHGCHTFLRRRFDEPHAPEELAGLLTERIGNAPGGSERLARMVELDRKARASHSSWVSFGVAVACMAVFALQLVYDPDAFFAGEFSAPLVRLGEYWRVVTGNLLHGSLFHLLLNVVGLRLLGALVERSLGPHATFFVLVLSGFAAMGASFLAGYTSAVGASGMVFGLAGALLWLEFGHPGELPVSWRLPRRLFVGVLLTETLLLALVPAIAGAAHAGGLVGGFLAARWVSLQSLAVRPAWLERVNAPLAALLLVAAVAAVWSEASRTPDAVVRRAERLLAFEDMAPVFLNNAAWKIAVSADPTEAELDIALRLAERAVDETRRRDPHVLDTLAEVHFVSGRSEEALAAIEEAIALDPEEPYYREQRRRFSGDRPADDRPEDPVARTREPADGEARPSARRVQGV